MAGGAGPKDFPPDFAPKPTVFDGGIDRMIKIWEAHRDKNDGGYGGGVVCSVRGWAAQPGKAAWTSCSPFTATVIGTMFDPQGGEEGRVFEPKYDNGTKVLPPAFYSMHQGNYFKKPGTQAWFQGNKWPCRGTDNANDSAGSILWFNLGYQIDPRDMRRGDMVAINWGNRGGHATFCWDVHLDDSGAVDCFLYLSANGGKKTGGGYFGVGVSVGTFCPETFVKKSGSGQFKKTMTIFEDRDEYIEYGAWYCLPGVKKSAVDLATFKNPPPKRNRIVDSTQNNGHYVASLRVVRFWGFAPPDAPHGNILKSDVESLARQLTRWPTPPSYASGRGTPSQGRIENPPVKQVPKSEPQPVKAAPPQPAKQQKTQTVGHQLFVETALVRLHAAGWIDKDPGRPDNVADAQSKAAIEDFQTKFKLDVDGQAGKKTRAALKKALEDLDDGKPNPNEKKPPKPGLEHAYWLKNKVSPGGQVGLAVQGQHLDEIKSYDVALTCKKSGVSQSVSVQIVAIGGQGSASITIPGVFKAGSALAAKITGSGAHGSVAKSSDALLYVAQPEQRTGDWAWDESRWPTSLTDLVKQLRAAPQVSGRYQARRITQYGVWDKLASGDTPVLDKNGREIARVDKQSLYLADLEGTMRLDGRILNLIASGNVFDPQMGRATLDRFDPKKSRWVDVTERAPWGMGARLPLIPFRTLAHNAAKESPLYGKKVFIEQLAGMRLPTGETHNGLCIVGDAGAMEPGKQFDLFVGPEGNRIGLPDVCNVEILG